LAQLAMVLKADLTISGALHCESIRPISTYPR